MRRISVLFLFVLFAMSQSVPVQAQSGSKCSYNQDGSITCTMSGGNESDNGSGNGNGQVSPSGTTCKAGEVQAARVHTYEPEAGGTCTLVETVNDLCSGEIMAPGDIRYGVECPVSAPSVNHPCTTLIVNTGGVTCKAGSGWSVKATVRFPEIYLDVRPYPATLVRWQTAIRNGGMPVSSGSGGVNYIPNGGGTPGNPREGDWQDLRLVLTLRPAGPMFVTLPHIGELRLANQGATGNPTLIQWEVPSHPAVGGGPRAGTIGGLDELPADMPLFVGRGRAPYKLFWELSYDEYEAIEDCVSGPNGNGNYTCGGSTGHKEVVGYDWRRHSSGGEIPPNAVANLPASLKADLNGDGAPDAYWDNNLTLRRMDDNNRVDNPQYQHSWNWGGIIYWAVREGQGQIGWPGQ